MTVRQKLEFLKQIQEHLLLSPDQYRLLIIHVLRQHRNERLREQEAVERLAA
jgi:hypothetical protein